LTHVSPARTHRLSGLPREGSDPVIAFGNRSEERLLPARLRLADEDKAVIAGEITSPVPDLRISLIVVGHSDRRDRMDFICDRRRASGIEAARDRAASA
jgi:hypothetical protein